jgi:hypothetical protein
MKIFPRSLPKALDIVLALLASIFFLSCEEVLQLDLSNIENQIVIEGVVSNSSSSSKIRIGLAQSAFEKSQPKSLSGALVTLSDDLGNTEVVKESQPGVFIPSTISGVPGRVYNLRVRFLDKEYSAESRMPMPMSLDSIKYVTSSSWFSFSSTSLKYYLTDKPGTEEFCLIKAYSLNSTSFVWTIYSDKYADGKQVVLESPEFNPTNSTLVVELISVDKATYEYFYALREVLGNSISIPDLLRMNDFNPKSNLTNNALGYFSAQAQSRYVVNIK